MTDGAPTTDTAVNGERRSPNLRWGVIAAFAVLIGLLIVLGLGLRRTSQGPIGVGDEVPDLILTTFDEGDLHFSGLRGQVVLVNFWASWCVPCESEAVELETAYQMYREQGVVFLGVDYVDTEPEARDYLERFNISYPNGPDLGTRISQAFRIRGVPETYVIGPDGRVAAAKIGPYESLEEIIGHIEIALAQ